MPNFSYPNLNSLDPIEFEDSDRYSEHEKTALRYTSAIVWAPELRT